MTPKNRGPVSKQMWHNDDFIVFKRHKRQAKDLNPLPAMIAFPYITIEFYLAKRKNKRLQLIKPFSLRTIINSGLIDGL